MMVGAFSIVTALNTSCLAETTVPEQSQMDGILDTVAMFFHSFPAWLSAITAVVTAATAVTLLTPSKADDRFLNAILRVLNTLAGNRFMNTNADDIDNARFVVVTHPKDKKKV